MDQISGPSDDPTTSPLHADVDEPLSESLFHSCISASEFLSHESDETKKCKDDNSEVKVDERSKTEAKMDVKDDTKTNNATITQTNNNNNSNEASNSSSASSWSHLPPPRTKVNSLTFNRERTCLILSTSQGVRIRTLESLHYSLFRTVRASNTASAAEAHNKTRDEDNEWIYDIPFESGVSYAQLHTSNQLAVILPNSPRCCYLYNAKSAQQMAAMPMSAAVKRVELTKRVLVCITADGRLHIFHLGEDERPVWIQSLNVLHSADSVRNISRGNNVYFAGAYFDLYTREEECYLVCKSFNGTVGTVRVYDPTNVTEVEVSSVGNASVNSGGISTASAQETRKKVRRRCHLHTTIDAHEHPVTRMLIGSSSTSSFVATASSKGTTIRVFGLPNGQLLWEWHRGSRSCQIVSLSWNGLGDRLTCYGSSNTIHVFEWNNQQKKKNGEKMMGGLEQSHDARDFEEIHEEIHEDGNQTDSTNRTGLESTNLESEKPLYKRISATIKRHTLGSTNTPTPLHRSFAKLKYQSTGTKDLVVAMLDRHDTNIISGSKNPREDTVVMCSLNGELRQYSVMLNGVTKLVQLEDVLVAA